MSLESILIKGIGDEEQDSATYFQFVFQLRARKRRLCHTSGGDIPIDTIDQYIADTVRFSIHTALRLDVRQDTFSLIFIHGSGFNVLTQLGAQRVELHAFLVETQHDPFCVQLAPV